jgi:hypothetical protein
VPGFHDKNGSLSFWTGDGFIVPSLDEHRQITGLQRRPFIDVEPRYLTPRGTPASDVYHVAGPIAAGCDLYVTEGALKAQVAAHHSGAALFGVPGQSLSRHIEAIKRLAPGRVIVTLDQEANELTAKARLRWLTSLASAGLRTDMEESMAGEQVIQVLACAGTRAQIGKQTLVYKLRVQAPTDNSRSSSNSWHPAGP